MFHIWISVFVLLVSSFIYAEEKVVEDIVLARHVQDVLLEHQFVTQVNFPKVIFYTSRPKHFQPNWVGLCTFQEHKIEILIVGNIEFDTDTYYHELYHWFTLDIDDRRAERFAAVCKQMFKDEIPKSVKK